MLLVLVNSLFPIPYWAMGGHSECRAHLQCHREVLQARWGPLVHGGDPGGDVQSEQDTAEQSTRKNVCVYIYIYMYIHIYI